MRVRTMGLITVLVLAGVAGSMFWLGWGDDGWTTKVPQAAAEFDRAIADSQKLYTKESLEHLERAVELDPQFVVAKAALAASLAYSDPERSKQLAEEARTADLKRLSPRERFLVRLHMARLEGDQEKVRRVIEEYGAVQPDDPWVLYAQAQSAWRAGEFDRAEPLYRRLIEVAPNWVLAYNELGYMAMGEGKFKEAEDLFVTYRFIAPDQANPHDSLGELYLLTGRYREARRELEEAIEVKPDFCASYGHLLQVELMERNLEGVRGVLERTRDSGACGEHMLERLRCVSEVAQSYFLLDWEGVWRTFEKSCVADADYLDWSGLMAMDAAAVTGRWQELEQILDTLRAMKKKFPSTGLSGEIVKGEIRFGQGLLSLREGDHQGALDAYLKADRSLGYFGSLGLSKLWIRLHIAKEYSALGRDAESEAMVRDVERVNPRIAAEFREGLAARLP